MKLENITKEFCQSKACNGRKREFIKIGYLPKTTRAIYSCQVCGHKIYKEEIK